GDSTSGGVLHDVIGVALRGSEISLQNRRVPVLLVTQAPVTFLQALHGEVDDGGLNRFLDAQLCGFVGGDPCLEFEQVGVVHELVDVGRQFIGIDRLGGGHGMQNGAGADVDAAQVHRHLVHAVDRKSVV